MGTRQTTGSNREPYSKVLVPQPKNLKWLQTDAKLAPLTPMREAYPTQQSVNISSTKPAWETKKLRAISNVGPLRWFERSAQKKPGDHSPEPFFRRSGRTGLNNRCRPWRRPHATGVWSSARSSFTVLTGDEQAGDRRRVPERPSTSLRMNGSELNQRINPADRKASSIILPTPAGPDETAASAGKGRVNWIGNSGRTAGNAASPSTSPAIPHEAAICRVEDIPASSICGIASPIAPSPRVASGVPWARPVIS